MRRRYICMIWHRWISFCVPRTLHELKTRIREACANTDQEILHNVWQEVEYRFDVARATRGAHIELY
jgi:hypothetical protein